MNKEKLKELAATLNGIADGKAWEVHYNDEWHNATGDPLGSLRACRNIRLKPWSLPPPPNGYEWHRSDGWTEEMLAGGLRPYCKGEVLRRGDPCWNACGNETTIDGLTGSIPDDEGTETWWYATSAYLPPRQQPDPYAELKAAHAAGKTIQALSADGKWRDWVGGDDFAPREPSNLRIKPETRRVNANPVRIPLCADDIKSGDEFLAPEGYRYQWESVGEGLVYFASTYRSFSDLKRDGWKIRSIGETEWRECSKEEEVEA